MESFLAPGPCFKALRVSRSIADRNTLLAPEVEVSADARAAGADKILIIRIEELGPNLMLYLSPILWETRNEVRMGLRMVDAKTGRVEAELTMHRLRGGPFTRIGADSLPSDLEQTRKAIFPGTLPDP